MLPTELGTAGSREIVLSAEAKRDNKIKNAQRASGRRHCNTLAYKAALPLNDLRIARI
jgi:hypothetical protein